MECDACHKRFRNSLLFESHLAVHLQDVSYSCDQCEKQFCQKTNLSRHKKAHKKENVIESLNRFENCPKAVISAKPVDMISRTDDVKNKNLSITECPETRFQNISEHTCTHCNKVFPTETKMRKHEQIHFDPNTVNQCII